MLKNYLKIALRNLMRNKTISLINVSGLALGIATCLIILLFVRYELSYDRFHAKSDQIVRVVFKGTVQGEVLNESMVMPPVAATLQDEFAEVQAATRLRRAGSPRVIYAGQTHRNQKVAYVDGNFLSVFTLPLVRGDAATALLEPHTVVISETAAKQFFGTEDALGKTLDFADWRTPYRVTGVMRDIPENSHLRFDLFTAMAGLEEARNPSWLVSEFYTYLVLPEGYSHERLAAKLSSVFDKHAGPQIKEAMGVSMEDFKAQGNLLGLHLQPLTDIHLRSDFEFDLAPHGDIRYLYLFGSIAIFMLLIACINFMNISTAGASKRHKEVGIRKVMGSRRGDLMRQFLLESLVLTSISMVLALVLVQMVLPFFNQLAGRTLSLSSLPLAWLLPSLLFIGLLTGVLAGSYPALYLSAIRPKEILAGRAGGGKKGVSLRGGLVVFQFFLTITMIISTVVVFRQLQYIQDAKLGYDPDTVMVIPELGALGPRAATFRQLLERDPRVERVSYSSYLPAGDSHSNNFFLSADGEAARMVKTLRYDVDEDYLPALGMQLASGRNFSTARGTDSSAIIVNQAALKAFGKPLENALDQTLTHFDNEGNSATYKVIGVVEDFHFKSLHERISPLVMVLRTGGGAAIIKAKTTDIATLRTDLKTQWETLDGDTPFSASLLDERVYATYSAERRVGILLAVFAGLTIFVACLGLFGLTIFAAERRTKEIGIRKVLGASVLSLVQLLTKDFLKLVAIAYALACPLAWWIMHHWLQDFAYHINFQWWIFALAGGLALGIAFLTVSFQSIKTALANPVQALRRE